MKFVLPLYNIYLNTYMVFHYLKNSAEKIGHAALVELQEAFEKMQHMSDVEGEYNVMESNCTYLNTHGNSPHLSICRYLYPHVNARDFFLANLIHHWGSILIASPLMQVAELVNNSKCLGSYSSLPIKYI